MSNLNRIKVVDYTLGRSDSEDVNTDVPFTENFEKTRTIQQANVVLGAYVNRNYKDMQNKADKDEIPTKLSELTNDVGYITDGDIPSKTSDLTNDGEDGINPFITNQVNDLANYTNNTDLSTLLSGKASTTDLNNVKSAIDYKSINYMGNVVVESIRSKNMFDKNSMVYSTNAYLPYNTSDTQLKFINILAGVLVIKLNEGKTYTISKIAAGRFRCGFTNTPTPALDTNNVITSKVNDDTGASITFTVPTNNPYFVCNFYSTDQTADVNVGYNNILNSIQIEEGTTATTYTPYQNLGGMENYSSEEVVIGTFLGKPLYRKVIEFGNLPNITTKNVNHNISNLDKIINLYGNAYDSNSTTSFPLPFTSLSSLNYCIALYATSSTVSLQTGIDRSNLTGYIVIEYTKN